MRGKYISLLALYALSVIVRIFPVFVTPLPYNVDAFLDARAAQFIAEHGNMNYPPGVAYNNSHTPITALLLALNAAISQLTGVNVINFLPYLFPFLTSISIFGWYLLTKKITGREEIGIMTAAFFAVSGTYVLTTAQIWKEAIGYILLPFALYAYRKRDALALLLLFALPLTHHYVALMTLLILSYSEFFRFYKKFREHVEFDRRDYFWWVSIILLWVYIKLYYSITGFNRVQELNSSGGLWLYLSLYTILILGGIRALKMRYNGINWKFVIGAMIIPVLFYLGYFLIPIFPHTMMFTEATLLFTLGYMIVLPLFAAGLYLMSSTEYPERTTFLGMLIAPLQMVLFFFLRGLELESYVSLGRNFDFLDGSLYTSLGSVNYMSRRRVLSFIIIFLIFASTTPLAYHSYEAFGVDNFRYPDELHAVEWLKENYGNETISTDDRLGLLAHNAEDLNTSSSLPYALAHGLNPPSKVWLVGSYWENGAQIFPLAPVKTNVTELFQDNSVVFSSGRTYVLLNETS